MISHALRSRLLHWWKWMDISRLALHVLMARGKRGQRYNVRKSQLQEGSTMIACQETIMCESGLMGVIRSRRLPRFGVKVKS